MQVFAYNTVPKELNNIITGEGVCRCYQVDFISTGQYQSRFASFPNLKGNLLTATFQTNQLLKCRLRCCWTNSFWEYGDEIQLLPTTGRCN